MCIRDSVGTAPLGVDDHTGAELRMHDILADPETGVRRRGPVSYTHLRAHETVLDLVCRLLLEKKKYT